MLGPLKEDLLNWRAHTRQGKDLELIFPSPDGSPWNADRVRNWRKRAFAEAAVQAEVPRARPYDLRHSFVSLLIAQGATVVDVARQAGHQPTMALSTYAHLFDEHAEDDRRPAAEQIWAARNGLIETRTPQKVPVLCPPDPPTSDPNTEQPRLSGAFVEPSVGLEPTTPSLPWKCSTS